MVTAESVTLWVHVAAGVVALTAGLGAIVTTKGGRRHRRLGRTYLYAMLGVGGTAIALFGLEQGTERGVLALIAVFSVYFAVSGSRALSRKRPTDGPETLDWVALAAFALASVAILATGGLFWLDGDGFAPVLLVFGAIGVAFGLGDGLAFAGRRGGGTWVGEHVVRMGAAYIATLTAFSTVNLVSLPVVARWLWPTVLGTPAIAYAVNRYEREFGLAD